MTYDALETAALNQPIELYEFNYAGQVYRHTSASQSHFVGANEFEPLEGLDRDKIRQDNEIGKSEIKVFVPANFEIALDFRGTIPSSLPTLTIFRLHLNDTDEQLYTYWKGTVISVAFDNDAATMNCQPITHVFDRPVPRATYSGICNHQLFDGGCLVNRSLYEFKSTVSAISADGKTLTVNGLRNGAAVIDTNLSLGLSGAELDTFFGLGYVEIDSPPERRMIVAGNADGDSNAILINIPMRDLSVDDTITVFAGCVHSLSICNSKFKNALRFGGFPSVPSVNPFTAELDV